MIAVITDSSSNITVSEAEREGIILMPLTIIFGDREYRDGVDIDCCEFYKKLISGNEFPHTAQLTETQIETAIKEALAKADEVIILPISSALSGSCDRCFKVAERFENVYVYDSKCTTVMLGILAREAVANREKSAAEVIEILKALRPKIKLWAALDTLEYLGKGGRISRTAARLGQALKIKPVVTVNDAGEVALVSKQFGISKSLNFIADAVKKGVPDPERPIVFIYTMDPVNCNSLIEKTGLKCDEKSNICPVIGTHIGPYAAGVVYVEK